MPRLLVAEDEPSLQMVLADRLRAEHYDVEIVADGSVAQERAKTETFDLLLLDVSLPGKSGFDVCRDLRADGVTLPILMLTARTQTLDKVIGLKLGADDYLTKPFEMEELLARLEALLRRSSAVDKSGSILTFGDIRIDRRGAQVTRNGEPIDLSALEFKLLVHLVEARGELQTREQLLNHVWGYEADVYTRTVDVHIASLRQKIEPNPKHPQWIVTVHGRGYKFTG